MKRVAFFVCAGWLLCSGAYAQGVAEGCSVRVSISPGFQTGSPAAQQVDGVIEEIRQLLGSAASFEICERSDRRSTDLLSTCSPNRRAPPSNGVLVQFVARSVHAQEWAELVRLARVSRLPVLVIESQLSAGHRHRDEPGIRCVSLSSGFEHVRQLGRMFEVTCASNTPVTTHQIADQLPCAGAWRILCVLSVWHVVVEHRWRVRGVVGKHVFGRRSKPSVRMITLRLTSKTGGAVAKLSTSVPSAKLLEPSWLFCRSGSGIGHVYVLGPELTLLCTGSQTRIDGRDSRVGDGHCRTVRSDIGLEAEDLGTESGTWVNERRISRPTTLRVGDRVRVGATVFEVIDRPAPFA